MSRSFERTFSVHAPVDRAWAAFTDPRQREAWSNETVAAFEPTPGGRVEFHMDDHGISTVEGKVEEVETNRLIRWSEGPGLLPWPTEITVTFESLDTGTRITVVQAGFAEGPEGDNELEGHSRGWDHILADLALYLETGISFPRFRPRPRFGLSVRHVAAGMEIVEATPGSYGERVGLRTGDLLLQLGDVGVYDMVELWALGRAFDDNVELEAVWARDGELCRATATL
jgi:uncharacterized protein YndB with AHSA1/START domain